MLFYKISYFFLGHEKLEKLDVKSSSYFSK